MIAPVGSFVNRELTGATLCSFSCLEDEVSGINGSRGDIDKSDPVIEGIAERDVSMCVDVLDS